MPNVMASIVSYLVVPIFLSSFLLWFIWRKKGKVKIAGKVVLITGASSGLGRACACLFYKAGAKVILAARKVEELNKVKQEMLKMHSGQTLYTPEVLYLDLSDIDTTVDAAKKVMGIHGTIDILINNAGMSYRGEIMETSIEVHKKLMNVNYFGQVALTKAILPDMIKQKQGHIIAISSVQGKLSIPFRSAYSASKHATQAFYDCLRAEVAHRNIQVSIFSPGYIKTNLSLNAMTGDGSSYGVMDKTTEKGMTPEYVATRVLQAVERKECDLLLAPFHHRLAVYLRNMFPGILAAVMQKRAQKQRQASDKSE